MAITVCNDCPRRRIGCHAECDSYKQQREYADKIREQLYEARQMDEYYYTPERRRRYRRFRRR